MIGVAAAWADDADDEIEEIVVTGEKQPDTAADRTLDRADIEGFPARSADELLRAVPGLHLSAHGGNGKAFQFLVRGFDAEHGSDLLVHVEGVPMNEPSNVHGQGYLDLHFLPTVLVDGLDLVKGSYRAEDGDFAITGTADYRVGLAREGLSLETRVGSDRSGGGTVAWRPDGRGPATFVVAEADGAVGVGEGRRFAQLRGAAGLDGEAGTTRLRAMAFAYDGTFASSGVLRADDLDDGVLGPYEAYPEAGGGESRRVLALGSLVSGRDEAELRLLGWASARALALDQNYSGYLRDPVRGDGTRQAEAALQGGARTEVRRIVDVHGEPWGLRVGADVRGDALDLREDAVTPAGRPWQPRVSARVRQSDLALWAEGRLRTGPLRLVPGLRADRLDLWLDDELDPLPDTAHSDAVVVSPKATGALDLGTHLSVFAAAGRGLRSPDARGIADGDRAPVMQSDSAEAGLRVVPQDSLAISATAFRIGIDNELVFDHLAGRFLSAGQTERLGVEGVADLDAARWLRLQADATYTDGRFTTTGAPIPYAPRWLVAGAAFVQGARLGDASLGGGVRAWYLGRRPLPSGFASHPSAVGSLTSTLSWARANVGLDVDNLFVGPWRDGEFVYPSWFDRTAPRSELQVVHVTAGTPFAVRLSLGITW